MIAFIGSVFSPYYAWARRRGPADPLEHCALNVVLHGPGANRWTMTERGQRAVSRSADTLQIGPSALHWDGNCLSVEIDEVTMPVPRPVQGRVRLYPRAFTERDFVLDGQGRHRWWPMSPGARVEVELQRPALHWSGGGYLDSNAGSAPLERDFRGWHWCRGNLAGESVVIYETDCRDGGGQCLALGFDGNGGVEELEPPPPVRLPKTLWRVARPTRSEGEAAVRRTLVDAPFYSRSVLTSRLLGQRVEAVHESLSLDRFRAPWVQMMLPFRVPRRSAP